MTCIKLWIFVGCAGNEQHEEKEDAYSPSDEDTYVPSTPSASEFESEEGKTKIKSFLTRYE